MGSCHAWGNRPRVGRLIRWNRNVFIANPEVLTHGTHEPRPTRRWVAGTSGGGPLRATAVTTPAGPILGPVPTPAQPTHNVLPAQAFVFARGGIGSSATGTSNVIAAWRNGVDPCRHGVYSARDHAWRMSIRVLAILVVEIYKPARDNAQKGSHLVRCVGVYDRVEKRRKLRGISWGIWGE